MQVNANSGSNALFCIKFTMKMGESSATPALLPAPLVFNYDTPINAPVPFSSCGSSSDWMKTTALDITGTIAPGSSVSISAQGTAAHAVSSGNYNMAIKFLGITVRGSLVFGVCRCCPRCHTCLP